jgi:hypothetical protein
MTMGMVETQGANEDNMTKLFSRLNIIVIIAFYRHTNEGSLSETKKIPNKVETYSTEYCTHIKVCPYG